VNLLERINQMVVDYVLSNGFNPDRVIIGPDDREELRKIAAECCRYPAPLGENSLMGMRIEFGPKTEVRAARLDLEIAR